VSGEEGRARDTSTKGYECRDRTMNGIEGERDEDMREREEDVEERK
jgi:hypothetical protein